VRPKILHVTQAAGGGVETSLLLMFRHFDKARFDLHLACPPGTNLAQEARVLGLQVFQIPMVRSVHPLRDTVALGRLMALVRRERYAIVHGHSAKGGYLARLAARLTGRGKTIYHPRAFSYLSQRGIARLLFLQLERLAVPLTDLVIATSESERRRAIDEVRFPEDRVVTIPNSVDFGDVTPGNGTRHANAGRSGSPVVLTVGRLSYQKNPEMFVRVAQLVSERRPDVRFVMLGGGFAGPLERRVQELIESTALGDRISILPWVSKAEALERISRCDVFVLTSRFEGMPNTLLEAMMLGRPIVATDVDGTRDVLAGGAGIMVPANDHASMAESVVELLEDPVRATAIAEQGARSRHRFDIRHNVDALAAVYHRLTRLL
jgi:glycosyltransferase involved in cell wall biosynthesis